MSIESSAMQRIVRGVSVLLALGLSAATALAYLLPVGWLTGLLQHFPAYYAAAWFGVACLAWLSQPSKRLAYAALMACLLFTGFWAFPRIPLAQDEVVEGEVIRIVWANLWHQEAVVEDFADWIDQLEPQPDVIGVAEVHHSDSLALLRERFPYGLSDPGSGLALFSRVAPVEKSSLLVSGARPILRMSLPMGANSLEVVAAHALVPVGVGHQQTFDRLAKHLADFPEAVLIGDLNASPWSREYSGLLDQAKMRDARRGQWPQATWHAAGWVPVRLPIDHALTRGRVEVLQFQVGPDIGSDHRPLIVDLKVENRAKPNGTENPDGH
jgi:endonuclease/exonuclease/phosphatase (EEP) superfamily protein YafD